VMSLEFCSMKFVDNQYLVVDSCYCGRIDNAVISNSSTKGFENYCSYIAR
jgi:hypothetical protein